MNKKQIWQFMRRTLYALKRQYGASVTVVKLDDAETDYRTGIKTIKKTIHNVRRAIMLPEQIDRRVEQGIAQLSANKMFVSQAGFDRSQTTFIFDTTDLPAGFKFVNDDHILVDGEYFRVTEVDAFEFDTGWIIKTHSVNGSNLTGTLMLSSTDTLTLSDEVAP